MAQAIDHVPGSTAPAEIASIVDRDGVVIVDDLLDREVLARFNAEIDSVFATTPDGRELANEAYESFFGRQTRHLAGVPGWSPVFAEEVLVHPTLLGVCDAILLRSCASYQLNIAHVLDRGPGSEQQYAHRDEDVWPYVPRPRDVLQVASIIALEDFTSENGATRIVPGSHQWEAGRQPEPHELVPAAMKAGAAVLYAGGTIHAGGPNTTSDQRRRGMHLSYLVGWLRTEENNFLTVPIETVRTLPRRAQELLGYRAHDAIAVAGGACGLVNTFDPMVLLERGEL